MKLKKLLFRKLGTRKLNKRQQRMWAAFEFLFRLLLLSIPLYLIIGLGLTATIIRPMQSAAAGQSAWILEQTGFRILRDDVFITAYSNSGVEPFNFMINQDCTGWKSMLFLFALIFAVPGIALRRRLWGLVFGLPAIWLGNLGRVVGVVLAQSAYGTEAALVIHDYLWQLGLIALVLGIWLVWLWWATMKREKNLLERLSERLQEVVKWRT